MTSGKICIRAIAKNNPPLKELATLINLGLRPQLFTLAGRIPKPNAIPKTTKINAIFMINKVFSSLGVGFSSRKGWSYYSVARFII